MQQPTKSDHPMQNSFTNATVSFTNDAPHYVVSSEIAIRDDGWVWVEEHNALYPPTQIEQITPNSDS